MPFRHCVFTSLGSFAIIELLVQKGADAKKQNKVVFDFNPAPCASYLSNTHHLVWEDSSSYSI